MTFSTGDQPSHPETTVMEMARAAKAAAPVIAALSTAKKNEVLRAAADALLAHSDKILASNEKDVSVGKKAGMTESLLDRLALSKERIAGIAAGLTQVAGLEDPVGVVEQGRTLPNGLQIIQVHVPLGVMGMVYEARPNVTADAFGLAFKSGNVALLRGSQSAVHSNTAIVAVLQKVCVDQGIPAEAVQLLPCDSHDSVQELITARGLVDVVIPRGGAGLINAVVTKATVPTIETGTGNCHVFVDRHADIRMAADIILNGKTRRPSVCNATETVLIDKALPTSDQLAVITHLQEADVTVHGDCDDLLSIGVTDIVQADEKDWGEEYLSMDIAVKRVDGLGEAVAHIAQWSSGHTDAIVTRDHATALAFTQAVDSAAVMVNASTAFTDGEQFGMGAEIGISTQKLHARGPMGLKELTTTKWIVTGQGQTRP